MPHLETNRFPRRAGGVVFAAHVTRLYAMHAACLREHGSPHRTPTPPYACDQLGSACSVLVHIKVESLARSMFTLRVVSVVNVILESVLTLRQVRHAQVQFTRLKHGVLLLHRQAASLETCYACRRVPIDSARA
jgi:hypothetical protein